MEHPCYYMACRRSACGTLEHEMEHTMPSDIIVCDTCGSSLSWERFRLRLGGGRTKEVSTCSTCRAKQSRAASCKVVQKKKQAQKQVVLNRTHHEYQTQNNIPYYLPKIEQQIRAYANKKTAKDRQYLRDHQHQPLSHVPYTAQQQLQAQQHAKGWIGLYDELADHAINLLRQTGTRPPWAQLEGKADLHRLYGVYDTKRARLLRERG